MTTRKLLIGGAWVVQSVEHPTLSFGSNHNLRLMRSSPMLGSPSAWSLLRSLSPSPLSPPHLDHAVSLK